MIGSMKFNRYEMRGIAISIIMVVVAFSVIKLYPAITDGADADRTSSKEIEVIHITPEEGVDAYSVASALMEGSTRSGRITKLVTQDVVVGAGATAQAGDVVSVSYIGTLEDGTVFDSSEDEPVTFTLGAGDVIRGWDTGIEGMRVGGKRILIIPASLAYGNIETDTIPKNSTLLFAIELLAVE